MKKNYLTNFRKFPERLDWNKFPEIFRRKFPEISELTTLIRRVYLIQWFKSNQIVRHNLLHFHLSHMAVHHHLLHHLHDHHLHLLLLVQSFTLNSRRGFSANHFLHRPFPFLPDWFHGLSGYLMFLFCSMAGFVCMVC